MAIVSCEHNTGRMGLCPACSQEASESVERTSRATTRSRELLEAAAVAQRYGLHDVVTTLRKGASERG